MGIQLLPQKGAQQHPPTFWPMSIVAKWSPISATAELLLEVHCSSCYPTTCIRTLKGTQNHVSGKFTHWPHAVLVHKLTPDALAFMLALQGQCLLQCNTLRLNTFSVTRHWQHEICYILIQDFPRLLILSRAPWNIRFYIVYLYLPVLLPEFSHDCWHCMPYMCASYCYHMVHCDCSEICRW